MTDTARDYQTLTTADTTGLDDFFASEDSLVQDINLAQDSTAQDSSAELWTVAEAAKSFGVSEKTILRRLQKGTINGFKVQGQFGLEWRIESGPTSQVLFDNAVTKDRTPEDIISVEDSPAQVVEIAEDSPAQGVLKPLDTLGHDRLIDEQRHEIARLRQQLEGAIYRNGYLESKLEDRETQIKLLTDTQNKGGWWARFSSWFFKAR
jgi:hypothetical protein